MKLNQSLAVVACMLNLLVAGVAHPITYKATILRHPNSVGYGASDGFQVGSGAVGTSFHALLWSGSTESTVDLHPDGFAHSEAFDVSGNNQVGSGEVEAAGSNLHALLWSGTAASAVDLHPAGYENSGAGAVSGNTQVGAAWPGNGFPFLGYRALMWNGTASSVVELHPAGFAYSRAQGVSGNAQVGTGDGHALLWSGSAASVIDLHPVGFEVSSAEAVDGNIEVGSGYIRDPDGGGVYHALMWSGTAASAVDLHPAGFTDSYAENVSGNVQVGYGYDGTGNAYALVWNGTAASAVNLHSFLASLPVTMVGSSASGVDANGTIVGHAVDANFNGYAILWTPVPEPNTWMLLNCGLLAAALVARRNRPR
jgi:hypothetical protein